MYNLNNDIEIYNQLNYKNINLNKSWGLFYLKRENLNFLNKRADFIRKEGFPAPSFIKKFKKPPLDPTEKKYHTTKFGKFSNQNNASRLIAKKISQRLAWEANLCAKLNEQACKQAGDKKDFNKLYKDWNIHKNFQYYSSKDLLFLLLFIIESQFHFGKANAELQNKKRFFIDFYPIPEVIAKKYESFLKEKLEGLSVLRSQVIDALLLHLRTIGKHGLVTCDDVSYTLALESQYLGLSVPDLPNSRMKLDTNTFNAIQRAVEKYGTEKHKRQLYQSIWYQNENRYDSNALTTVVISGYRLLVPKKLFGAVLINKKKWFWWFLTEDDFYHFLAKNQALFVQMNLKINRNTSMLEPVSQFYPELIALIAQDRLLRESLSALEKPCLHWWHWQNKFWKNIFKNWLLQELDRKKTSLLDALYTGFETLKSSPFIIEDIKFTDQVHILLKTIASLIDRGVSEYEKAALIEMREYLKTNIQANKESLICHVSPNGKQNLSMNEIIPELKKCNNDKRPNALINWLRNTKEQSLFTMAATQIFLDRSCGLRC